MLEAGREPNSVCGECQGALGRSNDSAVTRMRAFAYLQMTVDGYRPL